MRFAINIDLCIDKILTSRNFVGHFRLKIDFRLRIRFYSVVGAHTWRCFNSIMYVVRFVIANILIFSQNDK